MDNLRPKDNESKHDHLKRCSRELITQGLTPDAAFTQCNRHWNEARLSSGGMLTLGGACQLSGGQARNLLITAYTGKPIDLGTQRIIFDLAGMQVKESIPILREHRRDRIIGYSTRAWADESNFYLRGAVSQSTPAGQEFSRLADEGFPWQVSVGIWPLQKKHLASEGQQMTINGRTITGPAEIWTHSRVGEVSIVALGADSDTVAISLHKGGGGVTMTPFEVEVQAFLDTGKAQTRGEAIKMVARRFPELHNEYLEVLDTRGQIESEAWERIENPQTFPEAIGFMLQKGHDSKAAIKAAAEQFPELYQAHQAKLRRLHGY